MTPGFEPESPPREGRSQPLSYVTATQAAHNLLNAQKAFPVVLVPEFTHEEPVHRSQASYERSVFLPRPGRIRYLHLPSATRAHENRGST